VFFAADFAWGSQLMLGCRLRQFSLPVLAGAVLFCSQAAQAEVQVAESVAKHSAVSKPPPVISMIARQLKVSGHVEVSVQIDETGNVTDVKPTQGPPVLASGVVDAVKKWKFTPFPDASGAASKASTTLSFDFKQ
jgi:TonB family protein